MKCDVIKPPVSDGDGMAGGLKVVRQIAPAVGRAGERKPLLRGEVVDAGVVGVAFLAVEDEDKVSRYRNVQHVS